MNKQSLNKLSLFLSGLVNRFQENKDIFISVDLTFSAGLKKFKGVVKATNDKLNFSFNGNTQEMSIENLSKTIISEAEKYDTIELIYKERGTNLIISGDNKNIKIVSKETSILDEEEITETSTLLNRDYYIKVGKADNLLKEIGIMSSEGKIKNDRIRKYNQIDRYVELLLGILDKLPKGEKINILDCGCGKSYLTFVLNYYLTEVKKIKCHFIGLDHSENVIKRSKEMADNLGYKNMEFHAIDIMEYTPDKKIHVVMSLHACDTATDLALALGIRFEANAIIAVPCCHREMLNQYSYEPFKSIISHGVLKARMADILTDGMRSLMLKAKGYDVSVIEYISPLETPKNIMIRAVKTKDADDSAMDEYIDLMSKLNVFPSLYAYLTSFDTSEE